MSQEAPRSPQEPINGPKVPEMKITGVNVTEYRSGIPIQGWENVEDALRIFQTGKSRQSRATQKDLEDNIMGDHGPLGLGLLFIASDQMNARRDIVTDMLQDAEVAIKGEYGRWRRSFDYDAMGTSFFKSSVEITRLPNTQDGYLLGLNAAYVGREVEDGLAETLGIEQGLQWKSVSVGLEPEGTNFRIDFDPVADRLQSLYAELDPAPTPEPRSWRQRLVEAVKGNEPTERPVFTGEAIVRTLIGTDEWSSGSSPFALGLKDGVEVSLKMGRVGERFNWREGKRDEPLWKAEGSVLTGPLAQSYSEDRHLEPPSIEVSIRPYSEDKYDRLPAIDPKMKATMNELAEKVAAAFAIA